MELKEGMYVRTKQRAFQYPQIAKIITLKKDIGYHNQYYITLDKNLIPDYNFKIYEEDIKKASYNIIDLIEEGDYVNGYNVLRVLNFNDNSRMLILEKTYGNYIENEDIKSIITKEQFEAMEYRIGE